MSNRVPLVDFGPVALPVNALNDGCLQEAMDMSSRREDAIKLQRLIREAPFDGQAETSPELSVTVGDPYGYGNALPAGQWGANAADCLKLASSVASVTVRIASRVELTLSPALLPGSMLCVEKTTWGVRFDLHASDEKILGDLSQQLGEIVRNVGEHLQTRVEVRLYHGSGFLPLAEAGWHPGGGT